MLNLKKFVTKAEFFRALVAFTLILFLVCSVETDDRARLNVTIIDNSTGQMTPVRVKIIDLNGIAVSPPEAAIAVMWGPSDQARGYASLPDSSFYVDGSFDMKVEPGTYTIKISKGYEYLSLQEKLNLDEDRNISRTYLMKRWIDMPSRGWYSSDDHIHLRRSPRENPLILRWIAAEDIHIGNLLWMGDFWTSVYSQYAFGEEGRYQEGNYLLVPSQEEPRTPEIGHTISMGADDRVRFRSEYYLYDKVFDRIHELNGVSGYAHQGMSFHGYRGMTLDIPRNRIDFLELLQFCVAGGPLHVKHYYHFLDLGFKITAAAGSDFPWCGRGPRFGVAYEGPRIGDVRFYTYMGDEFSYEAWMNNLKAGHTFVSSGPILEFTVNNKLPGDELDVSAGTPLKIIAKAYGNTEQIPLRNLEIIGHGKVLAKVDAGDVEQNTEQLQIELTLPVDHGIWIAARCSASVTQMAHTTPVYIRVNGGSFCNLETKDNYLVLSEEYLKEIETELDNPGNQLDSQMRRHETGVRERIEETRKILKHLKTNLH